MTSFYGLYVGCGLAFFRLIACNLVQLTVRPESLGVHLPKQLKYAKIQSYATDGIAQRDPKRAGSAISP